MKSWLLLLPLLAAVSSAGAVRTHGLAAARQLTSTPTNYYWPRCLQCTSTTYPQSTGPYYITYQGTTHVGTVYQHVLKVNAMPQLPADSTENMCYNILYSTLYSMYLDVSPTCQSAYKGVYINGKLWTSTWADFQMETSAGGPQATLFVRNLFSVCASLAPSGFTLGIAVSGANTCNDPNVFFEGDSYNTRVIFTDSGKSQPRCCGKPVITGDQVCSNTPTVTHPGSAGPVDVYFLSDTTGSMGGAINNVKTNALSLVSTFKGIAPDINFGFGQYKDQGDVFIFRNDLSIKDASNTEVQAAVNAWSASGGGDFPERALDALDTIATDPTIGWRSDSLKFIVWFGDAPAKDPTVGGKTLSQVIADLQLKGLKVIAINVGALDASGQATAITTATDGTLVTGTSGDLSSFIETALSAQITSYITVKPVAVGCSKPGVTSTLVDDSPQTVLAGGPVCLTARYATPCPPPYGAYCTYDWVYTDGTVAISGVKQNVPACP